MTDIGDNITVGDTDTTVTLNNYVWLAIIAVGVLVIANG